MLKATLGLGLLCTAANAFDMEAFDRQREASQCLGSAGSYGSDKQCLPSWKVRAIIRSQHSRPPAAAAARPSAPATRNATRPLRLPERWQASASSNVGIQESFLMITACLVVVSQPTWDMKRSTVLYTCNNTGMHAVSHAVEYGTVVYDWSNAKQIWVRSLLTRLLYTRTILLHLPHRPHLPHLPHLSHLPHLPHHVCVSAVAGERPPDDIGGAHHRPGRDGPGR